MMNNKSLSALVDQVRGVSYKPKDIHDTLNDLSIVLLRANNIFDGSVDFSDVIYIDRKRVSPSQILRRGDILVCASSGSKDLVGKAASFNCDGEYTFGAFCKVVRPKNVDDADYISMFFQSPKYRREIAASALGANINNIRNEHIDNLIINWPVKLNRDIIVSLLNQSKSIITLRKKQLQLFDDLIKARFVEMFGDLRTNPFGFKKKKLKDTCIVITGNTPSRSVPEYYGDYMEWIKTDNIVTGFLNPTKSVEYLSEAGVNVGRTVEKDSILMSCIAGSVASIGRVCITNRKVAFNQQINAVIPKEYDVLFLYVMLQMSKDYLTEEINMALKGILSKSKLEEKEFVIPPIKQQKQFATFVTQVDKSKVAVQKSLEQTQMLFDSLLQQYFG